MAYFVGFKNGGFFVTTSTDEAVEVAKSPDEKYRYMCFDTQMEAQAIVDKWQNDLVLNASENSQPTPSSLTVRTCTNCSKPFLVTPREWGSLMKYRRYFSTKCPNCRL